MLNDFEREQCRNYKKMLDARQTPQGQIAARLAEQKRKEAERREAILKKYTEPPTPPDLSERKAPINPILRQYMNE
ncbi:hypothetical protein [Clostridium sp. M62/1]|uniref:hypothetical protein n=1 Tax=Clostridium sp. M62/1 TaxID=411486 RepID=UPI00356A4967